MASFIRKRIPRFEEYLKRVRAWIVPGAHGDQITNKELRDLCVHCHMVDMTVNEARDFILERILDGKHKSPIWSN